jgi:putative transcriptional regulator
MSGHRFQGKQWRNLGRKSMAKMSKKALLARDAKRDIAAEIRRGMREVRAGRAARVHHIEVPEALEARMRSGLSQQKFADMLGVSARTLQDWEQGRRKPTGAARSLLTIAARRPDVLQEVLAA